MGVGGGQVCLAGLGAHLVKLLQDGWVLVGVPVTPPGRLAADLLPIRNQVVLKPGSPVHAHGIHQCGVFAVDVPVWQGA